MPALQPFILLPDDDGDAPKALTPVTPGKQQQRQRQRKQQAGTAPTRPLIQELD
jgi:hypothetical protein